MFTNGNLQTTGQSMDVAIVGNGFLQVEGPNGRPAYTRAGQLNVGPEGRLTTAQGQRLRPEITIPVNAKSLTIGENGVVSITVADNAAPQEIGQLRLTQFVSPAGLLALGDNLYQETGASGAPTEGDAGRERPAASSSRARWKARTSRSSRRWST